MSFIKVCIEVDHVTRTAGILTWFVKVLAVHLVAYQANQRGMHASLILTISKSAKGISVHAMDLAVYVEIFFFFSALLYQQKLGHKQTNCMIYAALVPYVWSHSVSWCLAIEIEIGATYWAYVAHEVLYFFTAL